MDYVARTDLKIILDGSLGPRGDGYNPDGYMTVEEAKEYHLTQV